MRGRAKLGAGGIPLELALYRCAGDTRRARDAVTGNPSRKLVARRCARVIRGKADIDAAEPRIFELPGAAANHHAAGNGLEVLRHHPLEVGGFAVNRQSPAPFARRIRRHHPEEHLALLVAPDRLVGRDKKSKVFFWVVPANAAGKWRWRLPVDGKPADFELVVSQNFQTITGSMMVGGNAWKLENARLSGVDVSFTANDPRAATRYEFAGRIAGHGITGTARVTGASIQRQLEWDATRTELGTPAHALLKKPELRDLQQMQ